jgi:hypothetical protein
MTIPAGALRFNSDSGKLEYYNGEAWWQIDNFSADNATGGARGVFGGGNNVLDYITIDTTGNAQDFGDLLYTAFICKSLSSATRGLWAGARTSINTINYVTISSTGDAKDFGDLTVGREDPAGTSNGTRGVFGGGGQYSANPTNVNIIDYISISSTGDAIDFGDLTIARRHQGSCSSSVRGVYAGGLTNPANGPTTNIEFITFSSTGNAQDFGDIAVASYGLSGCSNSVRGLFSLGGGGGGTNTINYITISSTGNAQDFGDLTRNAYATAATSSNTRGIFGGTYPSSNIIDYVQIMTTGNAVDFGDLTVARGHFDACSNGHGGL